MLTIRKDYEVAAKNATNEMIQDISEMAQVVLNDYLSFDDVCDVMGCEEEELEAILNGTVEDMNLSEYNYIKCYFETVLKSYNDDSECENTGISLEDYDKCGCNCEYEMCHQEDSSIRTNREPEDTTVEITFDRNEPLLDFVNNINKELPEDSKINVEDALKAQKTFESDLTKMVKSNYDKIAKEANMELFGTYDDISKMGMESLKYLLKKNKLYNTIPSELKNHRQTVLSALYNKLEEKIAEKTIQQYNISKEDIEFNKRIAKLSNKFKDPDDILSEIQKILND